MSARRNFVTLCYDNYPDQREFVFAIKGRPFSMLSSQRLPVPSVSLIDFNLVSDLGLRMSDLQCSKFTFGGQKLRILGRISQTVQTITDGVISGTMHIRANVVEGLSKIFDSHSIAGKKMSEMLSRESTTAVESPPSSPTPSSSSSTSVGRSTGPPSPSPRSTPQRKRSMPSPRARAVASAAGRSLPPLSSPQPLNQHYRTTYCQPQLKQKPAPGIPRRTLALKPDNSHVYGRVVDVKHGNGPGLAVVDCMDNDGITSLLTLPPYTIHKELQVNDPVLIRKENEDADDLEDNLNLIMMVYDEGEEAQLVSRGVVFPECPSNLLPSGYYG